MAVAGVLVLLVINHRLDRNRPIMPTGAIMRTSCPWSTADLGQIAHYLDVVGDEIPVVFCNAAWNTDPG